MKLRALDQVHISAVQPNSLRPGDEFVVSDASGADLLKAIPDKLERIGDDMPEPTAAPAPISAKADKTHPNKAASAPANKAETRRKAKAE